MPASCAKALADDRLVHLHRLAGKGREHLAGRVELAGVDIDRVRHAVGPHVERHHNLFERGVAGAFADAIDRALDLTCTALYRGERVGHAEAEVVMAMRAEHDLVGIRHTADDAREEVHGFVGCAVTNRVRQVDRGRARLDDRFDDAAQEVEIAARCIFRRELHIVGVMPRVADRVDRRFEALLAADAQLRLQVEIRRGDERVNPPLRGRR